DNLHHTPLSLCAQSPKFVKHCHPCDRRTLLAELAPSPYQPRKPAADAPREGIILQDGDRRRIGLKGLYQFFRAAQRKAIDHIEECFRAARLVSSSSDGLFPCADGP